MRRRLLALCAVVLLSACAGGTTEGDGRATDDPGTAVRAAQSYLDRWVRPEQMV